MTDTASNKSSNSGFGVGSASIVLIFAVLCLTVFTLITYISASNYKSLVDAEVDMVTAFYKADAYAEAVLEALVSSDVKSGEFLGIEVFSAYNESVGAGTVYYYCPVSDAKLLYVNVLFKDDSYDILNRQMVDVTGWSADDAVNVWAGG